MTPPPSPFRRSVLASTLVPGLGLLRTRARPFGLVLLTAVAVALVAAAALVVREGFVGAALTAGLDRRLLLVAIVVVVVLGLGWVAGIVTTAVLTRSAGTTTGRRALGAGFTLVMCLVVAAPLAWAGNLMWVQRSLIGSIFPTNPVTPGVVAGGSGDAGVPKSDPWSGVDRVNLLLLGSDAGPGRTGVRPDSMMTASIDPKTGDTVLIGLPRNLQNVPFPESNPMHTVYPRGFNCGSECLLNAVWTAAEDRPDLFPGDPHPGLTTTRDVISEILGLRIDHTVTINLRGFYQLVDAMGGVTINARYRVPIGGHATASGRLVGVTGWIEPGVQHMDGYHALWYARSRATSDDYGRMRRQRCVAAALVKQVNPLELLTRYPAIAAAAKENITSDIPADALPAWAQLVLTMQKGTIRSLPVTNQIVAVTHPDFDKIRDLVTQAISGSAPATPDVTASATSSPTSGPRDSTGDTGEDDGTEVVEGDGPTVTDDSISDVVDAC